MYIICCGGAKRSVDEAVKVKTVTTEFQDAGEDKNIGCLPRKALSTEQSCLRTEAVCVTCGKERGSSSPLERTAWQLRLSYWTTHD